MQEIVTFTAAGAVMLLQVYLHSVNVKQRKRESEKRDLAYRSLVGHIHEAKRDLETCGVCIVRMRNDLEAAMMRLPKARRVKADATPEADPSPTVPGGVPAAKAAP